MTKDEATNLYNTSRNLLLNQRFKEAIPQLLRLRKYPSHRVRALTNLGGALFYMGHYQAAYKFLNEAVTIEPGFQPAHLNRANALLRLKKIEDAESAYVLAIKLSPLCINSKAGYLQLLLESSRSVDAEKKVVRWMTEEPNNVMLMHQYGLVLARMGRHNEAISSYSTALGKDSSQHSCLYSMASSMIALNQFEGATSILQEAIRLCPVMANYHALLGYTYWSQSLLELAQGAFSSAEQLEPESMGYFLNSRLSLPTIPKSIQQIEECRAKFKVALTDAIKDKSRRLRLEDLWIPHAYNLAYHNQDDRDILECYANLYSQQISGQASFNKESDKGKHEFCHIGSRHKVKIGFASDFFYEHSNARAFEGLIRKLDRERFEVVIIHGSGTKRDEVHKCINKACDQVVYPPGLTNGLIQALEKLKLDILFITDIGMSTFSLQLASHRTAPIQITGWGTPVTSGFAEIDYYISSDLAEPNDADKLYSETLVRLPGLPCCYLRSSLSCTSHSREYYGLPKKTPLLGCLQQLHKIHPDFDLVMERIAIENPNAKFLIIKNAIKSLTMTYLDRLLGNAPTLEDRLILLPPLSRDDFVSISGCTDVLLDPLHYGSGITFFETSYYGTPIVTLEGKFLRSRLVAAGYRMMAIQGAPIAASIDEYVSIVTSLIRNPIALQALKSEIAAKAGGILYENLDYVREFERFCLGILNQK